MTIDRVSISFNAKPNVKIDGRSYDVSKQDALQTFTIGNRQYQGIKLDNSTYLAVTKKNTPGGKYQLDFISTQPKALEKYKVKIAGGKINRIGQQGDIYTAKQARAASGTFTFNEQFAQNFRKKAQSKAGQELRDAGLTIKDEELYRLRKQGRFDSALHIELTNENTEPTVRQQKLNALLRGTTPQQPFLNLSRPRANIQNPTPSHSDNIGNKQTTLAANKDDQFDEKVMHLAQLRNNLAKKLLDRPNAELKQALYQLNRQYQDALAKSDEPQSNFKINDWVNKYLKLAERLDNVQSSANQGNSVQPSPLQKQAEDIVDKLWSMHGSERGGKSSLNAAERKQIKDSNLLANKALSRQVIKGWNDSTPADAVKALRQALKAQANKTGKGQDAARHYVDAKLIDQHFMAKVEKKINKKFNPLELKQLKQNIHRKIAANSDLNNKPLVEIRKTAHRIMLQQIAKHVQATNEIIQELMQLPVPDHDIEE